MTENNNENGHPQFNLRSPVALKEQAQQQAKKRGCANLSEYIRYLIQRDVEGKK